MAKPKHHESPACSNTERLQFELLRKAISDGFEKIAKALDKLGQNNKPGITFGFAVGLPQNKNQTTHMPLDLTITNEQKIPVTLAPVTATGKPAKLDGAPTWTVQSGNATVVPSADGLSADLVSADEPGDTEILVSADADLGAGVVTVSDVIRLSVAGAQAASLGLTAGTAVPK
jgi:hypothetical protein